MLHASVYDFATGYVPFEHKTSFQLAELNVVATARQDDESIVEVVARVVYVRVRNRAGTKTACGSTRISVINSW